MGFLGSHQNAGQLFYSQIKTLNQRFGANLRKNSVDSFKVKCKVLLLYHWQLQLEDIYLPILAIDLCFLFNKLLWVLNNLRINNLQTKNKRQPLKNMFSKIITFVLEKKISQKILESEEKGNSQTFNSQIDSASQLLLRKMPSQTSKHTKASTRR